MGEYIRRSIFGDLFLFSMVPLWELRIENVYYYRKKLIGFQVRKMCNVCSPSSVWRVTFHPVCVLCPTRTVSPPSSGPPAPQPESARL